MHEFILNHIYIEVMVSYKEFQENIMNFDYEISIQQLHLETLPHENVTIKR